MKRWKLVLSAVLTAAVLAGCSAPVSYTHLYMASCVNTSLEGPVVLLVTFLYTAS